ncbi:MAG: biopolymer transporter ExbD [Candidatus Zixiibacteriota bacterium]
MRRHKPRTYRSVADINIANLVDVVLVLLIIFMISAPLLQSGIEVELPKTKAAPMQEEAHGVVVTIDQKGGIYIDDVWARLDNFESALKDELKAKGTNQVFLRGDSTVSYGTVIAVIGTMKEMGIDAIGLVTSHVEQK